jgi:hypothetical protein
VTDLEWRHKIECLKWVAVSARRSLPGRRVARGQYRTIKAQVLPLGRIFSQIALNALSAGICLMP